jgi:PIN domain nuclease of toxin-antitoxin system
MASFHEMAVKIRKGNTPIEYSIEDALNKIKDLGINILTVKEEHIAKIIDIPKIYPATV